MELKIKQALFLSALIFVGSSVVLEARLDFAGDGISEIWKLKHPGAVSHLSGDADGDGMSNRDEGIAGTDPFDRTSLVRILPLEQVGQMVKLRWPGLGGKLYRLERFNRSASAWELEELIPVQSLNAVHEVTIDPLMEAEIYRIAVSDVDYDGDGLTGWEESQMGWSDFDSQSSGQNGESDFRAALREIESATGATLADGQVLAQRMPTRSEAVRFLQKASFGPTKDSIAEFCALGYNGWIENQLQVPETLTRTTMFSNGLSFSSELMRSGWWRNANVAQDQLRQRVAYALSQILVVNMQAGNVVGDNSMTQAVFYDIFIEKAFSPYREILEDVTYSSVMGHYLSHLKNRKSDPSINRYPDENFAREIMQLFTIGLWELNPNGVPKIDSSWERIPTYDNSTITEMAKVFTGMSVTRANNGQTATSFFDSPRGNDYRYPMKVWDDEHEPGGKTLLNGVVLDGTQSGEEEVQAALDMLAAHPNIAPFVGRLLIQRFTSANPSPAYIARVSDAWGAQENGMTGNLDKVIEAILLDPETLDLGTYSPFRGKVREPIIRLLNVFRAFNFSDANGRYWVDTYSINSEFGQFPTLAPSVFNFYLPDYSPAGELRGNGVVNPELQLSTATQMILSDNRFRYTIDSGHIHSKPDYTDELALAGDAEALVGHVSELLTGNLLSSAAKGAIITAVESQTTDLRRVKTAIHLVSQSMACTTLK